jgi:transketolase
MVHAVNSGHPGGSLGCTDFFVALYGEIMKYDPKNFDMDGKDEDLFFLSNGHISPVWYSVLARAGFFEISELATFRKLDSRLQGHPTTHEGLPGIRVASGSLGQGLSVALGAAMAKKQNGDDRFVYSLHGDGELQEGQIWEAAMFAGSQKLDHLIAFTDYNKMQIDGTVEDVNGIHPLDKKWEAFNWHVQVIDGHDVIAIKEAIIAAKKATGKPSMIILNTVKGKGAEFSEGKVGSHNMPVTEEMAKEAIERLG